MKLPQFIAIAMVVGVSLFQTGCVAYPNGYGYPYSGYATSYAPNTVVAYGAPVAYYQGGYPYYVARTGGYYRGPYGYRGIYGNTAYGNAYRGAAYGARGGSAYWHNGSGHATGYRGSTANWNNGSGNINGYRGGSANWNNGSGSATGYRGGTANWNHGSGSWSGAGGRSGSWSGGRR